MEVTVGEDGALVVVHGLTLDGYEEPLSSPEQIHICLREEAVLIGFEHLPGAEEAWDIDVSYRVAVERDHNTGGLRVLVWADGNNPDPVVLPIARRDYDPEYDSEGAASNGGHAG